jgi:4-hydroxybenzoate polyprenyltransferase
MSVAVTSRWRALLRLARPHQWIKNGFVLFGLVFSHRWAEGELVARVLGLTAAFCLVSGAVYALNDVLDREVDKVHPHKRRRPVAAGLISPRLALCWGGGLGLAGLGLSALISPVAGSLLLTYILVNVAYSLGLKHVAVLDVFLIAAGFMIRILAGTLGVGIEPSRWLFICGLMLTLFLGFAKRRAELLGLNGVNAALQRPALEGYSGPLLDRLIAINAGGVVIGYTLYVLDRETVVIHGTDKLIWTLPFVLYGVFRYLYALHHLGAGADAARDLLRDPHLLLALLGWLGMTAWLISA